MIQNCNVDMIKYSDLIKCFLNTNQKEDSESRTESELHELWLQGYSLCMGLSHWVYHWSKEKDH